MKKHVFLNICSAVARDLFRIHRYLQAVWNESLARTKRSGRRWGTTRGHAFLNIGSAVARDSRRIYRKNRWILNESLATAAKMFKKTWVFARVISDVPAGAPERDFSLAIRRIFSSRGDPAETHTPLKNHTLTSQRHGGGFPQNKDFSRK